MFPLELTRHPEIGLKASEMAAISCIGGCGTLLPTLVPTKLGASGGSDKPYIVLQANHDLHGLKIDVVNPETNESIFAREFLKNTNWNAWRPAELPVGEYFEKTSKVKITIRANGRAKDQFDTISAILHK